MVLCVSRLAQPLAHLSRRSAAALPALLISARFVASAGARDEGARLNVPPLAEGHCRLYLARHGETDWNKERRLQGRTDIALNAAGVAQAQALSDFLADAPFDTIASSPLQRAVATADAVARRHRRARRLRAAAFEEMCFGTFEGQRLSAIDDEYKATTARWAAGETSFAWPGESLLGQAPLQGESVDDVAERGVAGLRKLAVLGGPAVGDHANVLRGRKGGGPTPKHVLVVAHGRFNKILLAELTYERRRCSELDQGNTCVNVVDVAPDGACELVALNVLDHLGQPGRDPPPA
jgi:broad specificity phosphatase PhoE